MKPFFTGKKSTGDVLKREVGLFGAMMMGLGSILGTGLFVSIGIGAGVTGPSVILAIVVAAVVATLNGLSSSQLAANHPVSGGTYEYGYRWLRPSLGFTAGWMFLCAKSASAATAALGFAGYASHLFGINQPQFIVPIAVGAVFLTTLLVLAGIRRSNLVNIIIVSITIISVACFALAIFPTALKNGSENLSPLFVSDGTKTEFASFLEACALMFVAFTGYGRIATLGEEVIEPRKTIPKAIMATLAVASLIYIAVGFIGVASVGASLMNAITIEKGAALEFITRHSGGFVVSKIVACGAVTAMLGVLLNLILGLSRVAFAMGRRGDLPHALGKLNAEGTTPAFAVIAVGILIGGLSLIGNVKITWSFSAFTVLIYYALTNLSAIQLNENERLYPRVIPWLGLLSCLSLAFWVEPLIWMVGLILALLGLVLKRVFNRLPR